MKEDEPTFDEYRTGYIAARWNVSDNCAKALQLFELGFTTSGAAKHLPVTEGTVSKYHSELSDKIHREVVFAVTPSKKRFDVFGDFDGETYTQGKNDGEAARRKHEETQVTERKEQLDPEFREREFPLNRGVSLSEIDPSQITLDVDA